MTYLPFITILALESALRPKLLSVTPAGFLAGATLFVTSTANAGFRESTPRNVNALGSPRRIFLTRLVGRAWVGLHGEGKPCRCLVLPGRRERSRPATLALA